MHEPTTSPPDASGRRAGPYRPSTGVAVRSELRCRRLAFALIVAVGGCAPEGSPPDAPLSPSEWREFEGSWTAAGSRQAMPLGSDRRASIANLEGSLVLVGRSRPGAGFRARVIAFNDSASGMVGRAVWTDERGDQVFSELHGDGTATGNRIAGSFIGGTGRYAGAQGGYEFVWRFVLAGDDGAIQGQSMGLHGRVRVGQAAGARP